MRRRFWLALFASLSLHLLLLPDLQLTEDTEPAPRVILATLKTETALRTDKTDESGVLETESQPLREATAANRPGTPPEPKLITQAPAATPAATHTKVPRAPSEPVVSQATRTEPTRPQQTQIQPKQLDAPTPTTKNSHDAVEAKVEATPQTTVEPTVEKVVKAPPMTTQSQPQGRFSGNDEVFSDPREQQYYEQLMAHLRQKLPAHPAGIQGKVRLQITIKYGAVITAVDVLSSSGNPLTDEWARRAALAISPVPSVPSHLSQPYYFRPTLFLSE
ncbi:MAG: hypothetical protein CSH37_00565 [Thalassolituus sp.]|nr:MAG: hypothetical protein CSH37_00565 [Thalassolituus sp.]